MKSGRIPLVSTWTIALVVIAALMPGQGAWAQTEESIKVSKGAIVFDKENAKKGEIFDIDNKSESDLTIGIEMPNKGLSYSGVIRKPDQMRVPREEWKRCTLSPNSGVFIVVIPDEHRPRLEALDGTEIASGSIKGPSFEKFDESPSRCTRILCARPRNRIICAGTPPIDEGFQTVRQCIPKIW
jgi:hypothetical protein